MPFFATALKAHEDMTTEENMVVFHNKAILPLQCVTTFGVSVKEGESPIGYFGTGLKYAIAVLLREGCGVTIDIDQESYVFSSRKELVRGKEFEMIYMNDTPMPFTTELGKNWKIWQAYRELFSNCKDEGGSVHTGEFGWSEGTTIRVTGLLETHNEREKFLLLSEPKYVLGNLEVHESAHPAIFYRGIKVLELPTKYSYNILSSISLTEDRTASEWEVDYNITTEIVKSHNTDALLDILSITDEALHESRMSYSKYAAPSEAFMNIVAKLRHKPSNVTSFYNHYYPSFIGKLERDVLSPAVNKKLTKLKGLLPFAPKNIFVAAMDEHFKVLDEGLVLSSALLKTPKLLSFAYMVGCYHIQAKKSGKRMTDYQVITGPMLRHLTISSAKEFLNAKGN